MGQIQLKSLTANLSGFIDLDYKAKLIHFKNKSEKIHDHTWESNTSFIINKRHLDISLKDNMLMSSSVLKSTFPLSSSSDIENFDLNFGKIKILLRY